MSANVPLIVVAVGTVLALIDRLSVIVLCRMALRAGVDFEGETRTFGRLLRLEVKAAETRLHREHSTSRYEASAESREAADSNRAPGSRSIAPDQAAGPGHTALH